MEEVLSDDARALVIRVARVIARHDDVCNEGGCVCVPCSNACTCISAARDTLQEIHAQLEEWTRTPGKIADAADLARLWEAVMDGRNHSIRLAKGESQ